MEKKRFEFYQDVKVVTWKRQYFIVEAENENEAIEIAKECADGDIAYSEGVEVEEIEWLSDAEEVVNVADNDGKATIEVYMKNGLREEMLADNASEEEEEARELIGYQIVDCNGDYPDDFDDHDVFRTERDAQDWLNEEIGHPNNYRIKERFAEDEDDMKRYYHFCGKKLRKFKKDEEVCVEDDNGEPAYGLVVRDEETEYDEDEVAVKFHTANTELYVMAQTVYQRAEDKVCPRCGNPLYVEHHDEIDYPYYCPDCQENFYNFEAQ